MFAAALSGSAGVSLCSDAHLAILDHDHDLMDEAAVATRELEDFAGFHFPAFAVFALGVSAHRITGFGFDSHMIPQNRCIHLPSLSSQAMSYRSKLGA